MVSKLAVVGEEVVQEKPSVWKQFLSNSQTNIWIPGRVAAGAIAEKYLKAAYGIEIIAFVSSVGKIHLPSTIPSPSTDDDDDVGDALSEDFRKLLSTVTREQVDQHPTRCPHPETAELMTKVCLSSRTKASGSSSCQADCSS